MLARTWGHGDGRSVSPQGCRGEVPRRSATSAAAARQRAKRSRRGGLPGVTMVAEMMRAADEALQAEIEDEADREARRELMLQQAADAEERQRLEQTFALDRAQATQMLMQRAAEHEDAVRSRCKQLQIAPLDKQRVLADKAAPNLLHREGSQQVPTMPLHSRNWPATIETHDRGVIAAWAARNALRGANLNSKFLPGVFPSKSNPSPFASAQKLSEKKKVYPASDTPLPGRRSPFVAVKEDPAVTGPFLRRRAESHEAEIIIFDSALPTPMMHSPILSRESSREVLGLAPPMLNELCGGASKDSIGDGSVDAGNPGTPGSKRVTSPYRGAVSGSAPRRMKSTSPVHDRKSVRGISVATLESALSTSLSEQSRPGSSLTSTRDKWVQWDEAASRQLASMEPTSLLNARGELYSEANIAATMTKAKMDSTKREIIRTAVELPTGSALGVLGRERPVTAGELTAIRREAKGMLLTSSPHGAYPGSLHHNRHHSFQHRAVPCRPSSQRQKKKHYENVSLRSVVSSQMDRILVADGNREEQESHERALGASIAKLAKNDATSALSLFPGILQVLFSILDRAESPGSRLAVAQGLLNIARQSHVQETLVQGFFIRQDEALPFSSLLYQLLARSTDGNLTLLYAEIVACLCRGQAGMQECTQAGLLDLLEGRCAESGDPELVRLFEEARTAHVDTSGDTSITCWGERSDAQHHSGSASGGPVPTTSLRHTRRGGQSSSSSIGSAQPASTRDGVERKMWKPRNERALPLWERPADVIGVHPERWGKLSKFLRRPASPRHRE